MRLPVRSFNKRGLELAASILVILIISIILFALASTITYRLVCSGEEKIESYSAQQRAAFEKQLANGASVVVADASKTTDQPPRLCGGQRSLSAEYLIGVRNDGAPDARFEAQCPASDAVKLETSNGIIDSPYQCSNLVQSEQTPPLAVNARGTIPVVVNVPKDAAAGRYIFTLDVTDRSYSRTVNLYLTVI